MTRWLWNSLTASPVVLGASLWVVNSTFAAPISSLEPVFVQTDTAFSEDSTHSEKVAAVLITQMPDTEAEEPQFSALTPSEIGSSEELLAHKSVDEQSPTAETATTEPTFEVIAPIADDSSDESADSPMGQITNVSQLSDVSPGDWAYEALRSLVKRYSYFDKKPSAGKLRVVVIRVHLHTA